MPRDMIATSALVNADRPNDAIRCHVWESDVMTIMIDLLEFGGKRYPNFVTYPFPYKRGLNFRLK